MNLDEGLDEVYDTGANEVLDEDFASLPESLEKYTKDGEWRGGVRPYNIITQPEDIDWLQKQMRISGVKFAYVLCRYCGTEGRIRQTGSKWFYNHTCDWQRTEDVGEWCKRNGLKEEAA